MARRNEAAANGKTGREAEGSPVVLNLTTWSGVSGHVSTCYSRLRGQNSDSS